MADKNCPHKAACDCMDTCVGLCSIGDTTEAIVRELADLKIGEVGIGAFDEKVRELQNRSRKVIDGVPVPHPFKEWSGGGPVRPYCANCGRLRNDPMHASGVPPSSNDQLKGGSDA